VKLLLLFFGILFVLGCYCYMSGARHWCLTLNNYDERDVERFRSIGREGDKIDYFIFGREKGESGTPHLQCFVSFSKKQRFNQVKGVFGDRVHLEKAKGSPEQNRRYCSKEEDFEEFGICPKGRGARNDLAAALAAVKEGATRRVLIEEHLTAYSRAHRVLGEAMLLYAPTRNWTPDVRVYFGETGIGKTRKAFEETEQAPYMHSGGTWFDGYDGQPDVIFDDFGGSEFKLTYLLKLLDRYPMRVPVKGGFASWVPRRIWITSNYSPKEWFPNAKEEHVKALLRRFAKVVRFRRLISMGPHGHYDDDFDEVCV
jgi:hypothetical protein